MAMASRAVATPGATRPSRMPAKMHRITHRGRYFSKKPSPWVRPLRSDSVVILHIPRCYEDGQHPPDFRTPNALAWSAWISGTSRKQVARHFNKLRWKGVFAGESEQ